LASQRRFEGNVLEDLLDRVRAEGGPGAQIVAANRVRKGGLGGFFAREFFEVVVDVPEEADVVVDIDDHDHHHDDDDHNISFPPPLPSPARTIAASDGTRRIPASILDLAEAVNNTERDTGGARNVPTNGASNSASPGAPSAVHDVIDLVDHELLPASRFASILESLTQEQRPPEPTAAAPERSSIAAELQERMEQRAESARRTATAARVTSDPIDIREPEPEPVVTPTAFGAEVAEPQPAAFRRVPRTEAVIERPENLLAKLGLPARLIPRGASMKELRGALIQSLAELPASSPLPEANGVVVAVVGAGASAVVLARELCADYGLDPDGIVLASEELLGDGIPTWLQICDGPTAEERRRSWRRRPHPTFVAVNLAGGREALPWARGILDQLEPTAVWSIVGAGWKSEDARDWVTRLGGVDTLALNHPHDSVSPAAILELGIPVGRIEGRPATAVAWAEMLMARMQ
jgi:hypothetical protein